MYVSLLFALTMTLDVQGGPLLDRTLTADTKVLVHEGGTSSGKTVSLLQRHLVTSFQEKDRLISVCRMTVPNLKRGPMRDWENVLDWSGCAQHFKQNKVDHVWTNTLTGSRIEFLAVDSEAKARGPRRHDLHVNEATEFPEDIYSQLARRSSGQIFIDYNPSLIKFWVDDKVLTRDDVTFVHSTYKDNPFLTPDQLREIEEDVPVYEQPDGSFVTDWDLTYEGRGRLIKGDPFAWAVYGMGERGSPKEAIYTDTHTSEFPGGDTVIGLDIGFVHPMSMLRCAYMDVAPKPRLYYDQLFHAPGYTVGDLIKIMPDMGIGKREKIICDSARPDAIKELRDAGYNAHPAEKGSGSVLEGIDWMKRHEHHFSPRSGAAKLQFDNYRRSKKAGIITEDPVKHEDDAPDAARYACYETWGKPWKNPDWSSAPSYTSPHMRTRR